jgi:hypothetical protein
VVVPLASCLVEHSFLVYLRAYHFWRGCYLSWGVENIPGLVLSSAHSERNPKEGRHYAYRAAL